MTTISTSAALLARLNDLRVANNMKPLKAPKSIAVMQDDIKALTPAPAGRTSDFADLCREYGVNPKVGRALYRRHIGMVSEFDITKHEAAARELLAASAERIAA